MLGITKLKVPAVEVKPKLYFLVLKNPHTGKQQHFKKVHTGLDEAIQQCYFTNPLQKASINHYVTHMEMTIDEINSEFKHFNP